MEQQKFYDGVQCRFNLRKPKGKKATPIYCVTCIDGKQYKLPTNVKVYPKHWDKKQQVAIISNVNSKLDNKNNQITNERLEEIRQLFSEFILYLCNESPSNAVGVLYNLICKDMKKKEELSRFSINGQHLNAPQKGINIIKMSDGSTKKIIVK